MVGPLIATQFLGFFGAIVIFIVVFSSLASSIDSLLAATSDILTEDIFHKIFYPNASAVTLRKAAALFVIVLGLFAWMASLPRIGTLMDVLLFAGPMVASTIWPIAAGLYWKKTNRFGALLALVIGSVGGLVAYFLIGSFVAALIGATLSMLTVLLSTWIAPQDFNWEQLNEKPVRQSASS